MTAASIYLRSDDPRASYRDVLDRLLSAWLPRLPPDVGQRISAALAPQADGSDPLADDCVLGLTIPAHLLVPDATGDAGVQVVCRTLYDRSADPDTPPRPVGRAIDVVVYPIPTVGGPDLSGAVTLTALALTLGATEVRLPGWAWALQIPGTPWVLGRPDIPDAVYGVGACEERKPAKGVLAWREAQRQRLEAARQLLAAAEAAATAEAK